MTILHIDSSILGGNSTSRDLTAGIVAFQKAAHPELEVVYRDLAATPLPHLSGAHIAVWQGAAPDSPDIAADVAAGQAALAEFLAADIIVIGAPMYNFTIPSQLKAWIDRLVIAGTTFRYTATGVEGLVHGKKLIVASSRGGAYSEGTPAAFLDHQETYLRGMFGFMGVTDVTFIRAEGVAMGADQRAAAIAEAKTSITKLAA